MDGIATIGRRRSLVRALFDGRERIGTMDSRLAVRPATGGLTEMAAQLWAGTGGPEGAVEPAHPG